MTKEDFYNQQEFRAIDFMSYNTDVFMFFKRYIEQIKEDNLNVQKIKVDRPLYEELKRLSISYCPFVDHSENPTSIFGIKLELKDEVEDLKKENAITERIIIGEQMEIDRLEKENRELKLLTEKMETWINRIRELKEENEQLKQQIEQMKCCGNCKFCDNDNPCFFHKEYRQCVDYSSWELAE